MLERLSQIKKDYLKLQEKLQSEKIVKDPKNFSILSREIHHLKKIYKLILDYEKFQEEILDNKQLLKEEKDPEIISLVKEEIETLSNKISLTEQELKVKLLPEDPNDKKNVILEIRAGAGGDEASLFVQDLFEAYSRYAETHSWKIDIMSVSEGNLGGYKEIIASINGDRVYSVLKYESGVHRVQRVPKTETQGRIHTSTVTVVVLPEADPVHVKIDQSDLRIDVCRSSGAGGQHVNTTDSAVRIVHLPTKIQVYCQQGKSQHANKDTAFKLLYTKLLDFQTSKTQKEESEKRQNQMGTGDRSQRIRTYNFPQSRITDHRVHNIKKNLATVMEGDFSDLFSALQIHYQNLALQRTDKV